MHPEESIAPCFYLFRSRDDQVRMRRANPIAISELTLQILTERLDILNAKRFGGDCLVDDVLTFDA